MIIGIPREIKDGEHRVAMTPGGVMALVKKGHQVLVERDAGLKSGFVNSDFEAAGATVIENRRELFERAEMILKVKEPLREEYDLLHEGQILFTFLHLAANHELTKALVERKVIGVAYETVEENGCLPILRPMSEIAGRASILIGANLLSGTQGGRGVLISGIPGVPPAKVVIIGGGTAGLSAAKMACGLRSEVVVFEIDQARLRYLEDVLPSNVKLRLSLEHDIAEELREADLVVGAVLVPGARAPKVVSKTMVKLMKAGSVVVDIAIDQGGCFETSRPTTHSDPTFEVEGVIHYCVTNIPGIYPRTSTYALSQTILPYVLQMGDYGVGAFRVNPSLAKGVNVFRGAITNVAVAKAHGMDFTPLEEVL